VLEEDHAIEAVQRVIGGRVLVAENGSGAD
jgi:hypothetical protein